MGCSQPKMPKSKMVYIRNLLMVGVLLGWCFGPVVGAQADPKRVILVDIHELPEDCSTADACMRNAVPVGTNILSLPGTEAERLASALKARSWATDMTSEARGGLCHRAMPEYLHTRPDADKLAALRDHPGVFFDTTKLDATEGSETFSAQVRTALEAVGLPILSEDEWANTPGRPTLSVSYSAGRDNGGCIVPFSVSLSIKEDAVLVRRPGVKTSVSVYSAAGRQDLANTNYTHLDALSDVLAKFAADIATANADPGQ